MCDQVDPQGEVNKEFVRVNARDGRTSFFVPVSLPPRVVAKLEGDRTTRCFCVQVANDLAKLRAATGFLLQRQTLHGAGLVQPHLCERVKKHHTKLETIVKLLGE